MLIAKHLRPTPFLVLRFHGRTLALGGANERHRIPPSMQLRRRARIVDRGDLSVNDRYRGARVGVGDLNPRMQLSRQSLDDAGPQPRGRVGDIGGHAHPIILHSQGPVGTVGLIVDHDLAGPAVREHDFRGATNAQS